MTLQIVSLDKMHLEDAARLVCTCYRSLRQQEPLLPERYERVEELLPKLEKLFTEVPGVGECG